MATLVGVGPAVCYLAGLLNPNGLEIAAALSVWLAALGLAIGDETSWPSCIRRLGGGLVVLVLLRSLSPVFAIVIVLFAACLVTSPGRISRLVRRRDLQRWVLASAGALTLAVVWIVAVALPNQVYYKGIGLVQAVGRTGVVLHQSIWPLPGRASADAVIGAWGAVGAVLVFCCALRATRRGNVSIAALATALFVLPVTSAGLGLPKVGYEWQGRFGLALLAGLPAFCAAAAIVGRGGRHSRWLQPGTRVGVGILAGVQLFAVLFVAHRARAGWTGAGALTALGTVLAASGVLALHVGVLLPRESTPRNQEGELSAGCAPEFQTSGQG